MEENKKDVIKNLEGLLIKLLDAKNQENLTAKNKEMAMKDLIKLLNLYWKNIQKDLGIKNVLNKHQEIWYSAIIAANKKVKFPLLSITSGLFRCYIITLFGSIGEEGILKQLTGWNVSMLEKEKFTYDMKILFLSINGMIKDNESKLQEETQNIEGVQKKEKE